MTRYVSKKLTKEQVENLRKAIDLAEKPGLCRYVGRTGDFDPTPKPVCVIGQLMVLEGLPADRIPNSSARITALKPGVVALKDYPSRLLDDLQTIWDRRWGPEQRDVSPDVLRAKMHERVTKWQERY